MSRKCKLDGRITTCPYNCNSCVEEEEKKEGEDND